MQIQISWLLQKPTDLDLTVCKGRVYPGSAGQGLKTPLWGMSKEYPLCCFFFVVVFFVVFFFFQKKVFICILLEHMLLKYIQPNTKFPFLQPKFRNTFFFVVVVFGFYGPFKNISLISSQSFIKGGRKPENPGKNHLTIRKQNLAFPRDPSKAWTTVVRNLMD